jgi:1-acyl-sn-glycerol-3-phosphate acyltransferase
VLVRRAVLDPLWLPLAFILAAALVLIGVAGGCCWPVSRQVRAARVALFGALYLVMDAGLVVCCAGLWLRHPMLARRDEQHWRAVHTDLLRRALGLLRSAATPLFGFSVLLEEPPDAARLTGGPVLVLARHGGPGDSFTLVELLLSRYQRQPHIVLKEVLRWDPGLDLILTRLSSCFLPARGAAAVDLPARLAELASTLRGSDAMLIFPEGRNWTPRRYYRAIARLRGAAHRQAAVDAANNPNVLPPRPAGVLACLAARPDLDVVVIAHTGLEDLVSPAQVWKALPLTSRPMTVRWWYEAAWSVPADPAQQYQWLRVQWALVDSWIGARKAQADPGAAELEAAALEAAAQEAAGLEPTGLELLDPAPVGPGAAGLEPVGPLELLGLEPAGPEVVGVGPEPGGADPGGQDIDPLLETPG